MIHPRPVERVLAVMWLVIGVLVSLAAFTPWEPSLAINRLPDPLQAIIGIPLMAGGALILCGLRKRSILSTQGVGAIRAGALLCCGGMAADSIAVLIIHPSATVQLTFAAGAVVQAWQWQRLAGQEAEALRSLVREVARDA